ncbi:MAG: hypothetical protein IJA80_05690 [Clostridia bacterium]|nr:hypothetical protein [Clostridia bacterium]MBR2954205.1 hypothetical protein [Clostridia bacterium]
MKKWIIALVLILAVVIVFAACKGNEKEETPSQTPTQSTEPASNDESTDDELDIVPGDDLIISDNEYHEDENPIIIGGGSADNSGEDSIDWSEIKGKKS